MKDLAGFVDADLQGWLDDHSRVPGVLATCPLLGRTGLLISQQARS